MLNRKITSDRACSRVPEKINTGRVFTAGSSRIRSFSDKSESGIFLLANVFRRLSDLSENAEPCISCTGCFSVRRPEISCKNYEMHGKHVDTYYCHGVFNKVHSGFVNLVLSV